MELNQSDVSNRHLQMPTQTMEQSKITQFNDPKNSRVLDRKQIQKRLQSLKPYEYEKVINNLNSQNKRLKQEVKDLKQKVEELMIAKKISNPHHKNPLMEQEVKKAKKQLSLKYQSMQHLKQQLRKAKQSEITQQMRHKIEQQKQQIIYIDEQIKRLSKQKDTVIQHLEINKESFEEYHPNSKSHDERMTLYRQQNKQLKNRIMQLNDQHKNTQKKSKQALDKLYNLKQSEQKFTNLLLQRKTKLNSSQMKISDNREVVELQKQVQQLKRQKKQTQKQLVSEKMIKDSRRQKLEKQARKNLELHKQVMQRRMKMLNEVNLYEAKDKKHKQMMQVKQNQKHQIQYDDRGCQTDKIIPIDFRKQWIGKSEGNNFDDSQVLDYRSHVFIKSLIIYKTQDFIGFVKFFYENSQKKRYESKVPFESVILRKYESKKYTAKGVSYLQTFKVILTNEIVTGVSFTWSDGEVVFEGYQMESSTKFIADIEASQRPISMFGTVSLQNKNMYALESLGCEINKTDDDQ